MPVCPCLLVGHEGMVATDGVPVNAGDPSPVTGAGVTLSGPRTQPDHWDAIMVRSPSLASDSIVCLPALETTVAQSPYQKTPPIPPPPRSSGNQARSEFARGGHGMVARAGFWWSMGAELLGLLLFVLLFNLFLPGIGEDLGTGARIVLGLFMALVPALLWLLFFLRFDRAEPEPKHLVVRTLAAGALAYAALGGPLLYGLFAVDEWLHATLWSRLLGGVLVVGVVQQALVYVAVRYTVFDRPEFSERVDGIVYGVAAGLGVATVINFSHVLDRGGVDLDAGSVRMVINALAYGAIAGVLGYFMGKARFERVPIWFLPAGLAAAALFDGLLFFVLEGRGAGLQPGSAWGDLALATAVAILALASVFGLVARAQGHQAAAKEWDPVQPVPGARPVRPLMPADMAHVRVTAAVGEPEEVVDFDPDLADSDLDLGSDGQAAVRDDMPGERPKDGNRQGGGR